jgi:hypothetical protein
MFVLGVFESSIFLIMASSDHVKPVDSISVLWHMCYACTVMALTKMTFDDSFTPSVNTRAKQ